MQKFLIKFLVFSIPFILFISYIAYEIFILPVDHFTFRAWEALKVYQNTSILSGPFYPNSYLKKDELGDLSGLTKFPVIKSVEWYTDRYGYRKKASQKEIYKIVVIGDSAIAGSALTQSDMFTEKLGEELNVEVYAFAPSNFNKFLEDDRFVKNPPELIIFESVEKLVLHIPAIIPKDQKINKNSNLTKYLHLFKLSDRFISKIAVYKDRFEKEARINYLYARLAEIPQKVVSGNMTFKSVSIKQELDIPVGTLKMAFYSEPEEYFKNWKQVHIDQVSDILKGYQGELSKRETKFVFMPIPNKENIYWELVSGGKENDNLRRLINNAKSGGIVTIDLLTPYQKIHSSDQKRLIYHLDDSHWNSDGVDVAVSETIKILKENNLTI
ncbi:MAG: hypothetical protein ACD_26C00034G0038 [uncultured bacterium]|nr:MAG: hypothetical protein ACD_26C00034G0038 [uncultured bacterium]